jgi:dihydrodipicolinate synthase/N-acetylneuraminate lyase
MSENAAGPDDTGRWRGVFSILCTPFRSDGSLDLASLAKEVKFCLEAGAHGLVCNVNASESWTLSDDERRDIAEATVKEIGGHIPTIVGVSAGSLEVSSLLARHAEEIGADAVMAMPPPSRMGSVVDASGFYTALAGTVDLPVVIQNHDAPLGTRMSPDLVSSLVNHVPHVDWIKEETVPSGQAISRELELCGPKLKGIMGGMAGRYLLDEFRRGAVGTMPACESTDIHATIWNLLEAGQEDEARQVFNRLLPLLNYEAVSPGVYKTVLLWRGVLETDYLRSVSGNPLDTSDRHELKAILRSMADLFNVHPPA